MPGNYLYGPQEVSHTQNGTQSIELQKDDRLLKNMYYHHVHDRLYNFQPVRFQIVGFHHGICCILLRYGLHVICPLYYDGNLNNTIDQSKRLLVLPGGK